MHFHAGIHKVALNPKMVVPLLARVREIYELTVSPRGNTVCKDCELLEKIITIATR